MAVGLIAIASFVSLITFFLVGSPFGALNDAGNAVTGILSGVLALRLASVRRTGMGIAALAVTGAAVTVVGSWLVMTDTTGFFLAGLVSSVGFALIGAWVLGFTAGVDLESGLRSLGWVAGGAMLVGLIAVPGIILGIDDMADVPAWLWTFGISWLGTYVLYPAWCLWLGRVHTVRAEHVAAD
jgi:hypothetical protein